MRSARNEEREREERERYERAMWEEREREESVRAALASERMRVREEERTRAYRAPWQERMREEREVGDVRAREEEERAAAAQAKAEAASDAAERHAVAEASAEEERRRLDQLTFPMCAICHDKLNNLEGPGPMPQYCSRRCNDAIKVCSNGHIFHRGCILQACMVQYNQSNQATCPICRQSLLGTDGSSRLCNRFNNQSAVSEQELLAMTGGRRNNKINKSRRNKLTRRNKRTRQNKRTRRNKSKKYK